VAKFYQQVLRWQQQAKAEAAGDLATLVHLYCEYLGRQQIELFRVNLAVSTLHPQIQALRYVWFDRPVEVGPFPNKLLFYRKVHHLGGRTVDEAHLSYGARQSPQFKQSPFYLLIQGAPFLSYRLTPGTSHEYPILDDMAAQGGTHYYAANVPGLESHISLVTRAPGGFTPLAIRHIERSLSAVGLLLDGAVKDLILNTVLDCYVGYAPRDEIRKGNIRPGSMIDIEGAIWFSDIRKYSTHTQTTEQETLIGKLNAYCDCVVPHIYAQGGEVLKFIGDAIFAIFPCREAQTPQAVCRNAFTAAQAANRALAQSELDFQHGIGLHFGRFRYGNIGTLRRMDFTVIGNEVNVAARIEGQCSVHGQQLLMSETLVELGGINATLHAQAALKGIAGEFSLFVPAE
jgi:adenylate cyclase